MSGEFEAAYQTALDVARERSALLDGPSVIDRFARLPRNARQAILKQLSTTERARLAFTWSAWARPKQDPDLSELHHRILLWLAGRNFGKTRAAAERIRQRVYAGARRFAIIGPTVGEIEKYQLGVEDEDEGLLNIFPRAHRPKYIGRPTFMVKFHTGAIAYVITAEKAEFRGANLDTVWGDELVKWRFLTAMWSNIELATRSPGVLPVEIILTTTPKPIRFLKELVADEDVVTLVARSAENINNTDPDWLARMNKKYGGTRLGEQELEGEILSDVVGALFKASTLDDDRVETEPPNLRKVVSIDCAISTERRNDPTGIVGVGADEQEHLYVFADRTGHHEAEAWARIAVDMYYQNDCVAIVYEKNRGGNLIEPVIKASVSRKRGDLAADAIVFEAVHATKGKDVRAEPISAISEKHRLHMVGRELGELEDEITTWDPSLGGRSPNRLDAMVWGCWFLARVGDDAKPDRLATTKGLGALTSAASKAVSRIPSRPLAPRPRSITPSMRVPLPPIPKRTI